MHVTTVDDEPLTRHVRCARRQQEHAHLGKPAICDGGYDAWLRDIAPLAGLPHVVCKVSGLVTEAMDSHGRFDADVLAQYLDTALDLFGTGRLMFGSDWPVCVLAAPYARVTQIVTDWARRLTPDEQGALFGGTARRTYGIS